MINGKQVDFYIGKYNPEKHAELSGVLFFDTITKQLYLNGESFTISEESFKHFIENTNNPDIKSYISSNKYIKPLTLFLDEVTNTNYTEDFWFIPESIDELYEQFKDILEANGFDTFNLDYFKDLLMLYLIKYIELSGDFILSSEYDTLNNNYIELSNNYERIERENKELTMKINEISKQTNTLIDDINEMKNNITWKNI